MVLALLLVAGLAWPVAAEVAEVDEDGFVSAFELQFGAAPERVYDALVAETGAWWDPAHTFSGDALNLTFAVAPSSPRPGAEAGPGLALWERLPGEGNFARHLDVDFAQRGVRLRLRGGLGPLQALAVAGSMTFDLEGSLVGTKLTYRYTVTGRKLTAWADPVDRVMREQMERLRRYVETGSPLRAVRFPTDAR